MLKPFVFIAFITLPFVAVAQRTYCNPVDLNYQYNFEQLNQNISYRSGADPVIINHKGEYYLFATISGGYWHSKDLLQWHYVKPSRWPFEENCLHALHSRNILSRKSLWHLRQSLPIKGNALRIGTSCILGREMSDEQKKKRYEARALLWFRLCPDQSDVVTFRHEAL